MRPHRAFCSVLGVSQDAGQILLVANCPVDKGLTTIVVRVLAPIDGADLDLVGLPPLLDEFVGEGLGRLLGGEVGGGAGDSDVAVLHGLEPLLQGGDVGPDSLHVVLKGADATLELGNLLVLLDVLCCRCLDLGRKLRHLAGERGVGGVDLPLDLDLHGFRETDRLGSHQTRGGDGEE